MLITQTSENLKMSYNNHIWNKETKIKITAYFVLYSLRMHNFYSDKLTNDKYLSYLFNIIEVK